MGVYQLKRQTIAISYQIRKMVSDRQNTFHPTSMCHRLWSVTARMLSSFHPTSMCHKLCTYPSLDHLPYHILYQPNKVIICTYLQKYVTHSIPTILCGNLKVYNTCSGMEIRSPLMRVSTLLSSITEFMDSIQRVSTGASNTSHFSSGFSSAERRKDS